MIAIPSLIVGILSLWFAWLVRREYVLHRRLSHFYWTISLLFSALGSLSYAITMWTSPHAALWFRLYYLFGAMWMPSLMGLGSLALVFAARTITLWSAGVLVLGVIGSVEQWRSALSQSALQALKGGAGTGIIQTHPAWLIPLIVLNSFGALAVILVALISAWRTYRRHAPARFLYGNLWLACGVIVISASGSAARLGWSGLFWITMMVGWLITFVGYRFLSGHVLASSR